MRLFTNTRSPFGRVAQICLLETGFDALDIENVEPWDDGADLLAANPAARIPTLVLDDGTVLTESLLIAEWCARQRQEPTLFGPDSQAVLAFAGIGMGVMDAGVQVMVGRIITDGTVAEHTFDGTPIGLRRQRSMADGLQRLEAQIATVPHEPLNLGVICAIVALDYVRFRFPDLAGRAHVPALTALRAEWADRPSFKTTVPAA